MQNLHPEKSYLLSSANTKLFRLSPHHLMMKCLNRLTAKRARLLIWSWPLRLTEMQLRWATETTELRGKLLSTLRNRRAVWASCIWTPELAWRKSLLMTGAPRSWRRRRASPLSLKARRSGFPARSTTDSPLQAKTFRFRKVLCAILISLLGSWALITRLRCWVMSLALNCRGCPLVTIWDTQCQWVLKTNLRT